MNIRYTIGICALFVVLGTYLCTQFFQSKSTGLHVAVIQPVSHPALDEIVAAFKKTCSATCPDVTITYYNAAGNRAIMQSTIQDLLQSDISCLVTLGTDTTTLAVGYALERSVTKPICFMAAEPSEALRAYPYLTGVRSDFDPAAYCAQYAHLFSERKKILLVYDPAIKAGLNEADAHACEHILRNDGFTVTGIPIDKPSSIYERTLTGIHLHTPDTIMILMDNAVVSGLDSLIRLCTEYHILLFAADHNSCIKGAGAAFGHKEALFGSIAALQVCTLLHASDGAMPPIEQVQDSFMLLHTKHLAEQGITLSDAVRDAVIQSGGAVL